MASEFIGDSPIAFVDSYAPGLAKRELFAALLMPHFLVGQTFQGAARDAVNAASALLTELATPSGDEKHG